jgi:TRAP-type transport system small permease protein
MQATNAMQVKRTAGPLIQVLKVADRALMGSLRVALIVLLSGMALVVFTNVVMRYATGGSLVWAEEVARYAMVWLTFLASGPVLRTGGHIAIENLQDVLPKVLAQQIRAAIALALFGLGLAMVWMGVSYMKLAQYQMTAGTQISFAWIYAAIPVGGMLLMWCTAAMAVGYVSERRFETASDNNEHLEGVQI